MPFIDRRKFLNLAGAGTAASSIPSFLSLNAISAEKAADKVADKSRSSVKDF